MKLLNIIKDKIKEKTAPATTTLKKYKLIFQTVDGNIHELNRLKYIDEETIICNALDYYLIDKKFLQDDDGIQYPIQNIISIKFEKIDEKENVIKFYNESGYSYLVWYDSDEIKIFEKTIDN